MKTYNEGASDERTAWMKHVRRLAKSVSQHSDAFGFVSALVEWGKSRSKRCCKLGGIGRK